MDAARLTFSDQNFEIAVAVRFMGSPQLHHTHAGVCYRDQGRVWLIHMARDRDLRHEPFDSTYVLAIPRIRPRRLPFFLGLCRAIRDNPPTLRYALRHPDNARFRIQSGRDVVLTNGGAGLNCATFVLVFFQSYGLPLVNLPTWHPRGEDVARQRRLVNWVATTDPAQAFLIAADIGCARVRPEEVAGACLEEQLPVAFNECESNGRYVLQVLDGLLTVAEHEETKRIAYVLARARGNGQDPSWDPAHADEDYYNAASQVLRRRR